MSSGNKDLKLILDSCAIGKIERENLGLEGATSQPQNHLASSTPVDIGRESRSCELLLSVIAPWSVMGTCAAE